MEEKIWISRICPECGEEISLTASGIRKNSDLEGKLSIRCPKCGKGKIDYHTTPPLTRREITLNALQ